MSNVPEARTEPSTVAATPTATIWRFGLTKREFYLDALPKYLGITFGIVTVITASYNVYLATRQAHSASQNAVETRLRNELRDWQEAFVFTTIDQSFEKNKFTKGPSFQEIQVAYLTEGMKGTEFELSRKDRSDLALHKVLFELMALQLIFKLPDGTYVSNRGELQYGFGWHPTIETATAQAIRTLTTKYGDLGFTEAQLKDELIAAHQLTAEQAVHAIRLAKKPGGSVSVDSEGRLHCISCSKVVGDSSSLAPAPAPPVINENTRIYGSGAPTPAPAPPAPVPKTGNGQSSSS